MTLIAHLSDLHVMPAAGDRFHGIDPLAACLGDYGRAGNYFARQLARWGGQYREDTAAGPVADMARLRKALNEWWTESGEGQEAECGTTWLAARVILRAAAEKDRAIQKRRSR